MLSCRTAFGFVLGQEIWTHIHVTYLIWLVTMA